MKLEIQIDAMLLSRQQEQTYLRHEVCFEIFRQYGTGKRLTQKTSPSPEQEQEHNQMEALKLELPCNSLPVLRLCKKETTDPV